MLKSELAQSTHLSSMQQKSLQKEYQRLLQGLAWCSTIEEAEAIQEQITVVLQKMAILKISPTLAPQE